jgi:hypothetical protein
MKIPLLYSQVDYSDIDSRTDINEYEKSRLRNINRLKACELYIDLQHQLAICTEIKANASVKPMVTSPTTGTAPSQRTASQASKGQHLIHRAG